MNCWRSESEVNSTCVDVSLAVFSFSMPASRSWTADLSRSKSSSSLALCACDLAFDLCGVGVGDGDLVIGDVLRGPEESDDDDVDLCGPGDAGGLCVEVMDRLELRTSRASVLEDLLAEIRCLASSSERGLIGGLSCSSGDEEAD